MEVEVEKRDRVSWGGDFVAKEVQNVWAAWRSCSRLFGGIVEGLVVCTFMWGEMVSCGIELVTKEAHEIPMWF